jgi:tetratricopeptide (TPR) repeat protein/DNA-binding XRE family transcriptional regulator
MGFAVIIVATRRRFGMAENATFGGELRRLRRDAGVSLATLAQRVHYSKGYLSKVENGTSLPNPSLAALCDEVLETGGTLTALLSDAGGRRRATRSDGSTRTSFGLPAVTSHFTGRAAEVATVLAALRGDAGTCVLTGMAGVGKTALAVWCGRRVEAAYPDGVLFMDLHGHTPDVPPVPPSEALDRLLRLLGVPGEAVPPDVDDRAGMYRDRLRGRSVLVVLDNAESARQVLPLLPAEEKCRVLVTSRHRLAALDDAHHVPLGLLSREDGAALLRSLLRDRADHEDALEDALQDVVDLCGRLPLAIRVAAARLLANPSWRLADLGTRLGAEADRLSELDDGERSVAAAFRVSVSTMPAEQRTLLGLLTAHPGADFDLHAAAVLADLPLPATERLLAKLRDGHLIFQSASGRYHWHDLLRSFAATEIAAGADPAAVTRLVETELRAAEAADRLLAPTRYRRDVTFTGPPGPVRTFADTDAAVAWFRVEWQNLVALCRVAFEQGAQVYCWQLAFSLRSFFFLAKLWDPWIESQKIALAAAVASGDVWAQAVTLNNLGVATIDRGDLAGAEEYYLQALARFRELDDRHGVTTALANYAWVEHYRGEHRSALANLAVALDFYRAEGAARNAAITLRGMALVETAIGETGAAVTHAGEALATFAAMGLDLDITMTHNCLGWAHFRGGRLAAAEESYLAALESCERSGSAFEAVRAETGLGNVACADGRSADAEARWAAAAERGIVLDPVMVAEERARREIT